MGALGVRLRAEARSRWRSWLVLAVLIGAFSGVVLGVGAGARRTATAYPRFAEETNGSSALVAAFNTGLGGYYDKLRRIDGVSDVALVAGMPVFPAGPDGQPIFINGVVVAPIDGRFGYTMGRPQILAGRLPAHDRADEIFVNEVAAGRLHLRVGQWTPFVAYEEDPNNPGEELLTPFTARVTGIGRFAEEIVPTTKFDSEETLLMSRAGYAKWGAERHLNWDGAFVRLSDTAALGRFRDEVERLAAADAEQTGGEVLFADHVVRNDRVQRTIAPQAIALALFAAFAGLAGWLVLGQSLVRLVTDDSEDSRVLHALGLTTTQILRLTMARVAFVVGGAAVLAVAVAIGMSSLFPIGAARRAELHRGFEVNAAFLAGGVVAIVLLFLARALVPAWRASRLIAKAEAAPAVGAQSAPTVTARLAATGLPAPVVTGVRMALESGRGHTAVPVRTTTVGAVIGLAAVAAAMTFAANMDRVVTNAPLYGRTWDATFDGSFGPIATEPVATVLDASPAVARWSGGYYSEAGVAGRAVTVIGTTGEVVPTIIQGRAPERDDEVALGTRILRDAGVGVGGHVDVEIAGEERRMTVVGRAVFPALGRGSFPETGLGEGVLTTAAVAKPPPDPEMEEALHGAEWFNFYLIELEPGTPRGAVAGIERRLMPQCPEDQDCKVVVRDAAERPAEIANLDRIRWTPVVLAGLLATLAVATVGNLLVTCIRRRRRDLALLKTIGFVRRQVSATVAWQASTIAFIAAVVGIPLGVALGRVLWRALADQMGIVPDVVTPVVAVAVTIPVTILIVNLIAVVPGWMAGRIRPGVVLRTE